MCSFKKTYSDLQMLVRGVDYYRMTNGSSSNGEWVHFWRGKQIEEVYEGWNGDVQRSSKSIMEFVCGIEKRISVH